MFSLWPKDYPKFKISTLTLYALSRGTCVFYVNEQNSKINLAYIYTLSGKAGVNI